MGDFTNFPKYCLTFIKANAKYVEGNYISGWLNAQAAYDFYKNNLELFELVEKHNNGEEWCPDGCDKFGLRELYDRHINKKWEVDLDYYRTGCDDDDDDD
ncbi:hypothetical protein FACS189472_07000 [Alphaproteobacteria bacterium]|nr:hypothetical protein FACS189472_07000 [Alphaproteobacteria bacterium]